MAIALNFIAACWNFYAWYHLWGDDYWLFLCGACLGTATTLLGKAMESA